MTATIERPATCGTAHADRFSCCPACGRPGPYAFGPNVRKQTETYIERAFEFVEQRAEPFTLRDLSNANVWWSTGYKVLRIMEHHGWIVRVTPPGAKPVRWQRAEVTR